MHNGASLLPDLAFHGDPLCPKVYCANIRKPTPAGGITRCLVVPGDFAPGR
jgi:hypothetical protein